jgi:hypothetical protein
MAKRSVQEKPKRSKQAVCLPVPEEYVWRTDLAADAKRDPLDLLTDEEWAEIWDKVRREEEASQKRPKKLKSLL